MAKYRVHGYCLVPCEALIEVDASSEAEALQKARLAWNANKAAVICGNSADERAACDWQPTAELLSGAAD